MKTMHKKQYESDEIYIDTYQCDDPEAETLVKRERVLLDDDGNWLGTEEVSIS